MTGFRLDGRTRGVAIARAAVAAATLALAACTYRPGADNPVARSLTWFSYVGADDIRAACRPGAADRLRLIYNGVYDEQVLSYDVTALAGPGVGTGTGAMVEMRERGPSDLTRGFALADPFAPWRARGRLVKIGADQAAELRRALLDSGLRRPAPGRLRLHSSEFYWLANACIDGRFTVNAWKYPSPGFAALGFPAVLLGHDPTGTEFNPPRAANQYVEETSDRGANLGFQFELHQNRLLGASAAFGG